MNKRICLLACVALLAIQLGCAAQFTDRAKYGLTVYCPGAGNFDFGDAGIREGLREAGYDGEVSAFIWTVSFNPAIDQTARGNAKFKAAILADRLQEYIDRFPGRPVNLIGLSAGTGVAAWTLEELEEGYVVDNVVFLGSSLWTRYDMAKAMRHVKGKLYNYYSPNDPVLAGVMKLFGTIDGKFDGAEGAGAVGLHPRGGDDDQIVNIRYQKSFERYGYYGGHTDATNPKFVRAFISKHIVSAAAHAEPPGEALANRTDSTPPAGRLD